MIYVMKSPIEPGLLRIFRYFTGVAVIYFSLLWMYVIFTAGFGYSMRLQIWGNTIVYLGLYAYLSIPKVEQRLKHFFLPIGLIVSTISPVIGNFAYLLDPTQADIFIIINRSWLWLPVLFVPLVLIAWQYKFVGVLAYIIFTNGLELLVLLVVVQGKVTYENLIYIGVPLIRAFAFGVVGYIVCTFKNTQRLQEQKLIQTNIRLNQYADTLEQLATSRERNRLAAELHDTLAHTLSGLAVNLEAIKTVVPSTEIESQELLDHSLQITRSGLDETRRVLKALRAGPLVNLGLREALHEMVQATSDRLSIPVVLICPENLPVFPPDIEQNIYRIVQEGLENIVRHADARHAEVNLAVTDEQLDLTIKDDGSGFDVETVAHEDKFGLRGLRERAAVAGGRLTVESQPGSGTTIRFIWERFND